MRRPPMSRLFLLTLSLINIFIVIYFLKPFLITISEPENILFVNKECPFCNTVISEANQRGFVGKIDLEIIDISEHKIFQDYYFKKSGICYPTESQIIVPLLYSNGKCFKGVNATLQALERLSVSP